ncbi:helix-turn-helix domain-containing protein [Actinoplanes sp. TBRC 11911]|uniref:helix-turn-helix transcriptional regulator n=1 Tax=Actinoplanes sp. TBRC 11911 TaxID=2729386 RepID=UPI00145F2633|nr:helix-turn-helix transcriptional regulator [Actinoplanes sp. TBRC 11911]NMO51169.1 helix-turn-helix domain-containing protein [Actinoplanes sp. TBRC 11911]
MQATAVRPNVELGDFLRSRRARLDPHKAGVVSARRRRVQGLRREELAELAGVSVDYYTRLEQGRHASASPGVLDALARALCLPEADRAYLHRLAAPVKPKIETPAVVRPETRHLMRALGDMPAVLMRTGMDVLAINDAALRLYDGLNAYGGNGLRWMMTDPRARELHGDDWTAVASEMIGKTRLRSGRQQPGGSVGTLIDELSASSELFSRVWQDQTVSLADRRRKRLRHPRAGLLEFGVESLEVQHADGQLLVVFTPEPGSADERAWHEEMSRPV